MPLDPPQWPPQAAQGDDLLFLLFAQDIAHWTEPNASVINVLSQSSIGRFSGVPIWPVLGVPRGAATTGNPRVLRPLILHHASYQLRAGERAQISAPRDTLDFVLAAKNRSVRIGGENAKGLVVGPSVSGDEVLLAASLTAKPGEFAVEISAVSQAGEERVTTVEVVVNPPQTVPSASTRPPVVLLNGWSPVGCPVAPSGLTNTFGSLAQQLIQAPDNVPVVYSFDNCVECKDCLIEALGNALRQFMDLIRYDTGALVPQVDLVGHSMGGLISRAYLAGIQANGSLLPPVNPRVRKLVLMSTPNFGSFLAADPLATLGFFGTQAQQMTPGSAFLWNLATWNQTGDDLRGVDALAIVGNGGYAPLSGFPPAKASDGVVSLTSASIGFSRDPSRTRILPYCHTDPSIFIDCSGSSIANVDKAPEAGQIVRSFLAGTSDWASASISTTPSADLYLSQYGGVYFGLEGRTAAPLTNDLTQVSFGTVALQNGGAANTVFYNEFLRGTGTFQATSSSLGAVTYGPITQPTGHYGAARAKIAPAIVSVGPLRSDASGWVVGSGTTITTRGSGFGQPCPTCQAWAYPGPVALQVSIWSDQVITAFLPSTFSGFVQLVVQTATGSDAINIMTAPPPAIALTASSLQFAYTVGGAVPGAQSVQITNAGGGTLSWSATSSAPWLSVTPTSGAAPSALTVSVLPAGLALGPHTGTITISAVGAASQSIAVSLTVTTAANPPSIALTTSSLQFAYTVGGAVPGAQSVQITNAGGGTLSWSATSSAPWLSVTPTSGTAPSTLTVSVLPAGLAAGPHTATITISAVGAASLGISVSVTVGSPAGSGPVISSIVNAASFAAGMVPGGLATLFGKNLSPVIGIELPGAATSYKGVTVTVQGRQVPLLGVANVNGQEQINFQVPFDLAAPSTAHIEVRNNGSVGALDNVPLIAAQPGIFEYAPASTAATKYAAAIKVDGSVIGPNNPLSRGDAASVFLTGMGVTSPILQTGQFGPSNPPAVTFLQPVVGIGGVGAQVLFSGYAPGFLGLYQINIVVPAGALTGAAVSLDIIAGGAASQTSHVAVR